VLRSSRRMRIVGALLSAAPLVVLVLVLGLVGVPRDPYDRASGICAFALISPFFAYGAVLLAFANWRVDHQGLTRLTPLTRRRSIAWSDVTLIYEGSPGNFVLRGRFGTVAVPGELEGIRDFYRLALAHAPASTFSELARLSVERRLGLRPDFTAVPVDAPEPVDPGRREAIARWQENPFFVLGLSPECSRAEVERAGQKLLALLAIDSAAAKRFVTPVGEAARTAESVRAAMAELRDPDRRFAHEPWARIGSAPVVPLSTPTDDPARPWPEAMAAIGWRRE
jgi:hypothetical protein